MLIIVRLGWRHSISWMVLVVHASLVAAIRTSKAALISILVVHVGLVVRGTVVWVSIWILALIVLWLLLLHMLALLRLRLASATKGRVWCILTTTLRLTEAVLTSTLLMTLVRIFMIICMNRL